MPAERGWRGAGRKEKGKGGRERETGRPTDREGSVQYVCIRNDGNKLVLVSRQEALPFTMIAWMVKQF